MSDDFEIPEFDIDVDFDIPDFQWQEIKKPGASSFHFDGEDGVWNSPQKLRPCKPRFLKYEYAKEFIRNMKIPEPGGFNFALVSGSFYFGDTMGAIVKEINGDNDPARLDISSLNIGQENIDMIDQMFEEQLITEANFIFSDYFYAHERGENGMLTYLFDVLSQWPIRVSIGSIHTKIFMFKNSCYNIVVAGSANLRSSANVEQFTIHNDEDLWGWNADWMQEIHDKYDIVKKPIRNRNLDGIVTLEV